MKYCATCGQTVPDGSALCPYCGSVDLRDAADPPAADPAQPAYGAYAPVGEVPPANDYAQAPAMDNAYQAPVSPDLNGAYQNPGYYAGDPAWNGQPAPISAPAPAPKKSKTALLIAIPVAVILIGVIVAVVLLAGGKKSFTVGEVKDNVYTNEWADLQFNLGSEWMLDSGNEFAVEEHILSGFSAQKGLMDRIAVLFTDGASISGMSENDILNAYMEGITQSFGEVDFLGQAEQSDVTTLKIAGKDYKMKSVSVSFGFVNMSISIAVKKQNGHAIMLIVMGANETGNRNVLQSFTTVR